jgi:hypothetical protein
MFRRKDQLKNSSGYDDCQRLNKASQYPKEDPKAQPKSVRLDKWYQVFDELNHPAQKYA